MFHVYLIHISKKLGKQILVQKWFQCIKLILYLRAFANMSFELYIEKCEKPTNQKKKKKIWDSVF